MNVLIADDDASTRAALKIILSAEGYEVCWAIDGAHALEVFRSRNPDIVILDVMMPVLNGFEVCEAIRREEPNVPVLFLSAKGEADDRKCGLRLGADDYIAKPFDAEELLLRLRALVRRAGRERGVSERSSDGGGSMGIGPLEINYRRHEVTLDGTKIAVTPNEFQILSVLAERAGDVVTQREIIEALWGPNFAGESTSVAVYIRHLREKIEDDPSKPVLLRTVWGVGYRLTDEAV